MAGCYWRSTWKWLSHVCLIFLEPLTWQIPTPTLQIWEAPLRTFCRVFAVFNDNYKWSSRSYCWNIARKLFQRMSQKTIASKSFTIKSYSICRTKSEDTKHCSLHLSSMALFVDDDFLLQDMINSFKSNPNLLFW